MDKPIKKEDRKRKIAFINPYFGKYPNYFYLHLLTVKKNPDITWLFFTDDHTEYDWPDNAKVIYMSFIEMQKLVQSKFDFPVSLEKPYKLCDFKPAYGWIFQEYLEGYDFWGHCDIDVIWGDLNQFLPEAVTSRYELIYREGHLRLYRNTEGINHLFRKKGSIFCYREVFSHKEHYGFDEALGIQRIAERNHRRIYADDNVVADIDAFVEPLYIRRIAKKRWKDEAGIFRDIQNYKYQIFQWKDGKVLRYFVKDGKLERDEFMYLHLLKRQMDTGGIPKDAEGFFVAPDAFVPLPDGQKINLETVKGLSGAEKEAEGKLKEQRIRQIIRTYRRAGGLSRQQRGIALKKRFYFIFEKMQKPVKASRK